jgi:formylglycine-generating enzyme required for sulfatase activity
MRATAEDLLRRNCSETSLAPYVLEGGLAVLLFGLSAIAILSSCRTSLRGSRGSVVEEWAESTISRVQVTRATELGVPVAFVDRVTGGGYVLIPRGSFVPGERRVGTGDAHHRILISDFYLATCETTNAQYKKYASAHTSGAATKWRRDLESDNQPVVRVSQLDAIRYAEWLSSQDGGGTYMLPSDAQWAYACRAGAEAGDGGLVTQEEQSSPNGRGAPGTMRVGSSSANSWGLFDMHGNAMEWCVDFYVQDYLEGLLAGEVDVVDPVAPTGRSLLRVVRGGGWRGADRRCGARRWGVVDDKHDDIGFRLARLVR